MAKITPEIIVTQNEVDSRDNKTYIDHFIENIPLESQPCAINAVAFILTSYIERPNDNNVDITGLLKNIPEGESSQKIISGVIELNHYLKHHTWKNRQNDMKNHFDQFVCTLSSLSPAQPPQARQA